MKLESLSLAGFKSFADRTVIRLDRPQIAVVGPNGCGKSNIVDALRWIMGETRASQLRQETSRDIIFAGAAGRRPADWCSVELRLQNDGSRDLGMWTEVAEIAIKRQIERAGESQFFINGQRVRRRDVADLFSGTGAGARSYGVVEQEQVTQLVQSEPQRLRSHLEEAAGVATYKSRRRETERRLEITEANMTRLGDQEATIDQQADLLQKQARQAVRAREFAEQLKSAQALAATLRLEAAQARAQSADTEVAQARTLLAEARQQHDEARRREDVARQQREQANREHNAVLGQQYKAAADLELLRNRQREMAQARLRDESEKAAAEEAGRAAGKAQQELRTSISELESSLADYGKTESSASKSVEQIGTELATCDRQLAEAREALGRTEQEAAAASGRRNEAFAAADVARHRLADLEAAAADAEREMQALPAAREPDLAAREKRAQEAERVASELETLAERQRELSQSLQIGREEMVRLESSAGSIEGQLQLLEKVSQRASAKNADWFERHAQQDAQRLAKIAQLEAAGLEKALDAVIGRQLEGFVVPSIEQAHGSEDLPEGLSLVAVAGAPEVADAPVPPGTEPLAGRVTAARQWQPLIRVWLHGVYLAPSAAVARKAASGLGPGQIVVTAAGEIWGCGYAHGLLHREAGMEWIAAINKARAKLSGLEKQLAGKKGEQAAAEGKLEKQEKAHAAAEQKLLAARKKLAEVEDENRRRTQEAEFLTERRRRLLELIKRSNQDLQARRRELAAADGTLKKADAGSRELENRVQKLRDQLAGLGATIEKLRSEQSAHADAGRSASQSTGHARERLSDMRKRMQEHAEAIAAAAKRASEIEAGLAKHEQSGLAEQLAECEKRAEQAQKRLDKASAANDLAVRAEKDASQVVVQRRARQEEANENLHTRQMEIAQLEVEVKTCAEQLGKLECDREQIEALRAKHGNFDAAAAHAARLERKIEGIGPVNYAADSELAACRQRAAEIAEQREDLQNATAELRSAIDRIDQEMLARLKESFERINKRFGQLFAVLFDGGDAELVMTGESLLDAGLQLRASPPGKKVSAIQSLSGGEKTLTALAFLFALNDLNPPPFCVLDEVDAALDDANTRRFCQLLGSMSERSQFIVITHNKIVIDSVDQLVGVTQEQKGVSKVISVQVEEAIRAAQSHAGK